MNHIYQSHYKDVYDEARRKGSSHEEAQKLATDAVGTMHAAASIGHAPPPATDASTAAPQLSKPKK